MTNYLEVARRALADAVTPDPEYAVDLLNRTGTRVMLLDGVTTIGVWPDQDGPEIRAALRALKMDHLPVRHLDGDGIPLRYKARL